MRKIDMISTFDDIVKKILSETPVDEIEALWKFYGDHGYTLPGFAKYFQPEKQIRQKLEWVFNFGLSTSQPLIVLDIGTGAGWLPYTLKYFGHDVHLTDAPTSKKYNLCIKLLGMEKEFCLRVSKQESILDVIGFQKYDLISATGICFHRDWIPGDWRFFIDDCFRAIVDGGRLLLRINNEGQRVGYESFLQYLKLADFKPERFDAITWMLYKP